MSRDPEKQRAHVRKHYENNKDYYKQKAKRFDAKRGAEINQFLCDYLSNHPCVDCGESDIVVLEFDHRDPSQKLFNVSDRRGGYKLQSVIDEVAKCDIRCANCHRRKTFAGNNYRNKTQTISSVG